MKEERKFCLEYGNQLSHVCCFGEASHAKRVNRAQVELVQLYQNRRTTIRLTCGGFHLLLLSVPPILAGTDLYTFNEKGIGRGSGSDLVYTEVVRFESLELPVSTLDLLIRCGRPLQVAARHPTL
jgi:hypothetical protein